MTRLERINDPHIFWSDDLHASLRSWVRKNPPNKRIYAVTGLWPRLWIIFDSAFYARGEGLG